MILFNPIAVASHLSAKERSNVLLVALLLCVAGICSHASAATSALPSAGKAVYKTIYSGTVLSSMASIDDSTVELREIVGITQSDPATAEYAGLSARCLVYFEATSAAPLINGSCTLMDGEGDKIHQRFGSGKILILGGTGKYSGISGEGKITNVKYVKSQTDTSRQFEVTHEVEWLIE